MYGELNGRLDPGLLMMGLYELNEAHDQLWIVIRPLATDCAFMYVRGLNANNDLKRGNCHTMRGLVLIQHIRPYKYYRIRQVRLEDGYHLETDK